MLGSNQRPLPCEGSKIACQSVVEITKSLQIAIFFRAHCALVFGRFTRVCCMVAAQGYGLMRTKSGMIVIRPVAWRPLLRASSWVSSANFLCTEFSEIRQEFIANPSLMTSMDLLCNERGEASPGVPLSYGKEVFQLSVREVA
jgi:hypothetical protein